MPVIRQTNGHVLLLTIDRPEAMNALDPETSDALTTEWLRFRDDEALRVAVLTGAGDKAFSAGIDLKRLGEWYGRVPPERRREVWDREPGLGGITRNLDVGKPVIAAINGHCLGGGLELALACDMRIASEKATFALPELKWGIIPGQGGTQRLPRTVAPGHALEMVLSGTAISARRAYEIGLVNAVTAPAELIPSALRLAETIACNPPRAVKAAREAVLRGRDMPLAQSLGLERSLAEPLDEAFEDRVG
ncbi:MAG: enoyl-CoA hydratase/isomerase family protein [Euryarchaeota archaeon]|nr:enoyl-CoA hydratase/isomerase family protein [Euryarchaeota archaeon]